MQAIGVGVDKGEVVGVGVEKVAEVVVVVEKGERKWDVGCRASTGQWYESLKNFSGSLLAVFPVIASGGAHLVIVSREPRFDQFKHSHPFKK